MSAPELGVLFDAVQRSNDGWYPPANVASGVDELTRWAATLSAHRSYAATAGDALAGWVQTELWGPDPVRMPLWCAPTAVYPGGLSEPGDVEVISRLVVHPDHVRRGIAGALLDRAVDDIAAAGRVAVLAVLAGSKAAEALYASRGAEQLGEFVGLGSNVCTAYRFPPK